MPSIQLDYANREEIEQDITEEEIETERLERGFYFSRKSSGDMQEGILGIREKVGTEASDIGLVSGSVTLPSEIG